MVGTTAPKPFITKQRLTKTLSPGGRIPSVATIGRLLAGVGHVDRSPRKRPKSSYVPFARSTAMALWQLDAFEYRTAKNQLITIYQLIDDASRFDVGSRAFQRHENSQDAQEVLARAITEYGAPQEVLCDNSKAFNQLRSGTFGSVRSKSSSHPREACRSQDDLLLKGKTNDHTVHYNAS